MASCYNGNFDLLYSFMMNEFIDKNKPLLDYYGINKIILTQRIYDLIYDYNYNPLIIFRHDDNYIIRMKNIDIQSIINPRVYFE